MTPVDEQLLHSLETSGDYAWSYRHRGASMSSGVHGQSLWAGVSAQFVVSDPSDPQQLLGSICFYGYDARNGFGHLAFLFTESARRRAWPLRGVFLFFEYIFNVFPVRFLIGESLHFNLESFRSAIPAQLVEHCGTIAGCEYHDGAYWDKHIVRVTRASWDRYRDERLLGQMQGSDMRDLITSICSEFDPRGSLAPDGLWLDTPVGDLGLDSLGLLELATALDTEIEMVVDRTPRELIR